MVVIFTTTRESESALHHLYMWHPTLTQNPDPALQGSRRGQLAQHVFQANVRALGVLTTLSHHDLPRKERWPALCKAANDWSASFSSRRKVILDQPRTSWQQHIQLYCANVLGVVLRMYFAKERWLRRLYQHLCIQYQCNTAIELARQLGPMFE